MTINSKLLTITYLNPLISPRKHFSSSTTDMPPIQRLALYRMLPTKYRPSVTIAAYGRPVIGVEASRSSYWHSGGARSLWRMGWGNGLAVYAASCTLQKRITYFVFNSKTGQNNFTKLFLVHYTLHTLTLNRTVFLQSELYGL